MDDYEGQKRPDAYLPGYEPTAQVTTIVSQKTRRSPLGIRETLRLFLNDSISPEVHTRCSTSTPTLADIDMSSPLAPEQTVLRT